MFSFFAHTPCCRFWCIPTGQGVATLRTPLLRFWNWPRAPAQECLGQPIPLRPCPRSCRHSTPDSAGEPRLASPSTLHKGLSRFNRREGPPEKFGDGCLLNYIVKVCFSSFLLLLDWQITAETFGQPRRRVGTRRKVWLPAAARATMHSRTPRVNSCYRSSAAPWRSWQNRIRLDMRAPEVHVRRFGITHVQPVSGHPEAFAEVLPRKNQLVITHMYVEKQSSPSPFLRLHALLPAPEAHLHLWQHLTGCVAWCVNRLAPAGCQHPPHRTEWATWILRFERDTLAPWMAVYPRDGAGRMV